MKKEERLLPAFLILLGMLVGLGGCEMPNNPPNIVMISGSQSIQAGDDLSIRGQIIDLDGDDLSWEIVGIADQTSGYGSELDWNICLDVPGEYQFVVTATDSRGGSSQTIFRVIVKYHDCTSTSVPPVCRVVINNASWGRVDASPTLLTCELGQSFEFSPSGYDPDDGMDWMSELRGITQIKFWVEKYEDDTWKVEIEAMDLDLKDPHHSLVFRSVGLRRLVWEFRDNDLCLDGITQVFQELLVEACPLC